MAYEPQTWVDDDPLYPASAARLSHIEDGLDAAADVADAAQAAAAQRRVEPVDARRADDVGARRDRRQQ